MSVYTRVPTISEYSRRKGPSDPQVEPTGTQSGAVFYFRSPSLLVTEPESDARCPRLSPCCPPALPQLCQVSRR